MGPGTSVPSAAPWTRWVRARGIASLFCGVPSTCNRSADPANRPSGRNAHEWSHSTRATRPTAGLLGAKAAALAVAEMRGVPTLGGVLVGVKAPFDHHHRHRTCRVPIAELSLPTRAADQRAVARSRPARRLPIVLHERISIDVGPLFAACPTIATRQPSDAHLLAAASPAIPSPITITSHVVVISRLLRSSGKPPAGDRRPIATASRPAKPIGV